MTLEELYISVPAYIDIDYFLFSRAESMSAPLGKGCVIAIDPSKIRSQADEMVKVAHELGHCETWSFYSPGEDYFIRQRGENRANKWAIKKLIPQDGLMEAVQHGITEPWELAEYFNVTQAFMETALWYYARGNMCMERSA